MARTALDKIDRAACDGCMRMFPGWALLKPLKSDTWKNAVCGGCLEIATKASVIVATTPVLPWETEMGKFYKAQRNISLDGSLWAVMPGSPLTLACQTKWADYRAKLNRMTVDCSCPEDWRWPEPPKNEYPILATASATTTTVSAQTSTTIKVSK